MTDSDEIRLADGREDVLSEQRLAFRRQIDIIQNLDDKALRTVRISFLLVGAIVSAGGLSARDSISIPLGTKLYGAFGVVFLLSTIFLGIVTFDTTQYKTRLSAGEYVSLVEPKPPRGDHKVALRKMYRDWSENARNSIRQNRRLFAQMQTSFFTSTILIASSGGWMMIHDLFQKLPESPVIHRISLLIIVKTVVFLLFPVAVLVLVALGTRATGILPNYPTGQD